MSSRTAAELSAAQSRADKALQLAVTSTAAYWKERLRYQSEVHQINLALREQEIELLEKAVQKAKPGFFEKPAVVSILTGVTIIGSIWVAAEIINTPRAQ